MSKLVWKPAALLAPVPPALVSCGTLAQPNVFTVAWTGIVNTHPAMTYISVRPERYSYSLISQSGEFVINLTTAALVRAADFCGVRSGREVDKFAACGLTAEPASQLAAPLLAQSPLSVECRVRQRIPLGTHEMFLSEIVAVDVDPSLIDDTGKLHLAKAGLAAYAHGEYFALGERLGTFGFSVRKKAQRPAHRKKTARRRTSQPPR
ncbi:MAG: flavin reductase family protein [Anaerotruncus sp.]|nr:flavin reductase family protein [Anaerotruncus sp.]